MSVPDVDHPAPGSAVDVMPVQRRISVNARVESADERAVVVRPSDSDHVDRSVVAVGEEVQVFWHGRDGGRALPAVVAQVERGAASRWILQVTGPAEDSQRRTAVRARVALPVTVLVGTEELEGETIDLSESGVRASVKGYGRLPEPGAVMTVSVALEQGPVRCNAEVRRVQQERGGPRVMSLRFVDLPERDQDQLRRRVFQVLREERARAAEQPGG